MHCEALKYLIFYLLNFNGPSTAPIEYQNYYERDATADRNGSAGFVGGVMKRSELHNGKHCYQRNDDEDDDYYIISIHFGVFLNECFPQLVGFQISCRGIVPVAPN